MKNKFAYNSNSYHGFSVDQALEGMAAAGFKYVELSAVRGWTEHVMPDMPDAEIERIQKKMAGLGIEAVALGGHCNLMEKERLEDFAKNIELAHRLGIGTIVTSTGEAHFGEDEEFSDNVLIENISSLIPVLDKYDMTMVLEIHGEHGTGEQLYSLTRKLDSPRVGINYDTANVVFFGGKSPMDDIKTCVDDVKHVHLKDKVGMDRVWCFPATGSGDLDLAGFMDFLDGYDYDGVYSIEVEYDEEFTMREKDQPGDLDRANQAAIDSYAYLKSIGRVE